MKAAVIERQGGVENIVYREWPDPDYGPDDVLVRVRACALNHLDIFVRRGMPGFPVPMPFISGGDIAGEIAAVGAGVTRFRPGERVSLNPQTDEGMIGEELLGGLAELVRVPAKNVIAIPDQLDFERAAATPIAYGTALRMLVTRGRLQAGETVLVLGASGGVGIASVQIAKMLGAAVIAVAGSAAKCARLLEIGADHAIDMSSTDFSREAWRLSGKRGVDMCVNFTGGDTYVPSLRTLRRGGRLVTCGATAGFDPKTDLRFIWVRELEVLGSNSYSQDDVERALAHVASGKLDPVIGATFPLHELAAAETLMERRDFVGKIVLLP
ncbi:MAG: zinc-binding dehydrogenase [Geminicoccaceae bacterium]|nr:MAG: zinc-binding dehydrogenase [Geminicoccaceae bacterium]